jgi:hypothetical protein
MNYPLIPLWSALGFFGGINVWLSAAASLLLGVLGLVLLAGNVLLGYRKGPARVGLICLLIALVVSVIGIVYIVVVPLAILAIYLLVYWVLWRILVKNLIAAVRSGKAKNEDPDRYTGPQ